MAEMKADKFKLQTVKVTQKLINLGAPEDEELCPVALALKQIYPARRVFVDGLYYGFNQRQGDTFKLPARVARWITRFDEGEAVNPIQFQIAVHQRGEDEHG